MTASKVRTLPAPKGFRWETWTGKLRQEQARKPHLKVMADVKPRISDN